MATSNVPTPQMAQTENKQTLFDQLHKNGDQNYKIPPRLSILRYIKIEFEFEFKFKLKFEPCMYAYSN